MKRILLLHRASARHPNALRGECFASLIAAVISLALFCFSPLAQAAIPATERNYLIAFYNQTNGANWTNKTNWLGAAGTECTWHGVTCDQAGARVSGIQLQSNGLTGSLPADLNALSELVFFYVSNNAITGNVPAISTLSMLTHFRVNFNQFSGSIPTLPASIKVFNARSNALNGTIPALSGFIALVVFDVGKNQLVGTLPSLAGTPNLSEFRADENALTGVIPIFLNAAVLTVYSVANNSLTGAVPSLVAAPNLQTFSVSVNQLSGFLPDLSQLSSLKEFLARENNFTGTVPSIKHLAALTRFDVGGNDLIGTLPSLAGLVNLTHFNASFNRLTGEIAPLTGLTSLQSLELHQNQLTGSIPILNGSPLTKLTVNGNQLSGAVPTAPAQLTPELSWLCPNQLTPSADAAWDAATFGAGAWSANCIAPRLSQTLNVNAPGTQSTGSVAAYGVIITPSPGSSAPHVALSLTPSICTATATATGVTVDVAVSTRIGSRCRYAVNKAGDATYNSTTHIERSILIVRNVNPNTCKLDADGNGELSPGKDDVLVMRYLMGFRGSALTQGLTLSGLRTTGAAIASYLDGFNFNVTNAAAAPANTRTLQNAMVILRYLQAQPPLLMLANTGVSAGDAFSVLNNVDAWCPKA